MEPATSNGIVDVDVDVERDVVGHAHLANHTVHSLSWEGIEVSLQNRFRSDLRPKSIISDVDGLANAGKSSGQLSSSMSNRR